MGGIEACALENEITAAISVVGHFVTSRVYAWQRLGEAFAVAEQVVRRFV
jgi:hypothetical protein